MKKHEGSEELREIGQVWPTAKAEVFSVTLDLEGTGEKFRFMMVPNKPKRPPQAGTAKTGGLMDRVLVCAAYYTRISRSQIDSIALRQTKSYAGFVPV